MKNSIHKKWIKLGISSYIIGLLLTNNSLALTSNDNYLTGGAPRPTLTIFGIPYFVYLYFSIIFALILFIYIVLTIKFKLKAKKEQKEIKIPKKLKIPLIISIIIFALCLILLFVIPSIYDSWYDIPSILDYELVFGYYNIIDTYTFIACSISIISALVFFICLILVNRIRIKAEKEQRKIEIPAKIKMAIMISLIILILSLIALWALKNLF